MFDLMRRSSWVCVVALSVVAVLGCKLISHHGGNEGQFARIDADDNGQIEVGEYEEFWTTSFAQMDDDGDGEVSYEDFESHLMARHDSQDMDGNGHVSHSEMMCWVTGEEMVVEMDEINHPEMGEGSHFESMDVNDDGVVSQEEFVAEASRWIVKADENEDGRRSPDEMQARMRWLFENHLDANDDGVLEKDEIMVMYIGK